MSVAELQELEEVKLLLTKGQTAGVLTYAEIATALAEVELDDGDIEDLHTHFEKSEIELVEEIDPATVAASAVERAPDKRGRRKKATHRPQAGHDHGQPPAVPQGHRQGPPAHRAAGDLPPEPSSAATSRRRGT